MTTKTTAKNDTVMVESKVYFSAEEERQAAAAAATATSSSSSSNATQERVSAYILQTSAEQFKEQDSSWSRVKCPRCNASRYLYCPDCTEILIPRHDWPSCIRNGTLRLPFDELHIILDDRRMGASGVQVATILRAVAAATASASAGATNASCAATNKTAAATNTNASCAATARDVEGGRQGQDVVLPGDCSSSYRLFDQALDEGIPDYQQEGQSHEGTYLLFPDQTSVPLSSVSSSAPATDTTDSYLRRSLKRLVVLDCKWTNSSLRLHPHLACLPKVHLDNPPETSYFWRWHSAGKGMLSTVEAIYYAATQMAEQLQWCEHDQEQLVHLLWLFGLQRQVICRRFIDNKNKLDDMSLSSSSAAGLATAQQTTINTRTSTTSSRLAHEKNQHLPFTENAKEIARALRQLQKHRKNKDTN